MITKHLNTILAAAFLAVTFMCLSAIIYMLGLRFSDSYLKHVEYTAIQECLDFSLINFREADGASYEEIREDLLVTCKAEKGLQ